MANYNSTKVGSYNISLMEYCIFNIGQFLGIHLNTLSPIKAIMRIIAVINYKGGVGKTTFTVSTSQALALVGFRVLAIDNDSQHNLSLLLGEKVYQPNIRDVYRSSLGNAGRNFMRSIRKTGLLNLHIVTSNSELCTNDIKDPYILQKTIVFCSLHRFYDFIFIDNPPGIDIIQEAAIHASDEIFVPTELSYFAINGLSEMDKMLSDKFRGESYIQKIIPNFFRNTIRQKSYLDMLKQLFPGKVAQTAIPYDTVFDICMKERKTLFLNRLYSKAAAYYLKLVHELFNLDEEETWEKVVRKRNKQLSIEARERYFKQQAMHNTTSFNKNNSIVGNSLSPGKGEDTRDKTSDALNKNRKP